MLFISLSIEWAEGPMSPPGLQDNGWLGPNMIVGI